MGHLRAMRLCLVCRRRWEAVRDIFAAEAIPEHYMCLGVVEGLASCFLGHLHAEGSKLLVPSVTRARSTDAGIGVVSMHVNHLCRLVADWALFLEQTKPIERSVVCRAQGTLW